MEPRFIRLCDMLSRYMGVGLRRWVAATIIPTVEGILTRAATTTASALVPPTDGHTSRLLQRAGERVAMREKDDGGNPPQHSSTACEAYLLTPLALLAVVKAWDVGTCDPLRTDCARWLDEVYGICERHGIPAKQRARCASHRMNADCKEAALAAGCHDMTWGEFAAWLSRYDGKPHVLTLLGVLCQHIRQVWGERVPLRPWYESRRRGWTIYTHLLSCSDFVLPSPSCTFYEFPEGDFVLSERDISRPAAKEWRGASGNDKIAILPTFKLRISSTPIAAV